VPAETLDVKILMMEPSTGIFAILPAVWRQENGPPLFEIMGLRHLTQSPAFSNVNLNTIYLLAGSIALRVTRNPL
jgi:hypothetical protein